MAKNIILLVFLFHFLSLTQCENVYIVHMDKELMPKVFKDQHEWYKSTLDSISSTTITSKSPLRSKLIYSYTHAIDGFSATLTPLELQALKSTIGFLHSSPEKTITLDTTHTPKFMGLNPILGAWPTSDYGKDIIVGVFDSGVWPESKSYDDMGFTPIPSRWRGTCQVGEQFNSSHCNRKLIGAQYFNKGLLASNPGLKISMNSARDTSGHGTHTSSTAAGSPVPNASFFGYAKGTATGMAPLARVAVYKVVWDEGASNADFLAAVDKAIADGVDIMSISAGADADDVFDDPVAISVFAAMEKGIFVSLAAGNTGPTRGTLHNGTPWALTVGAGTVDRLLGGSATLGNGVIVKGGSLSYGGRSFVKNSSLILMNNCDDLEALRGLPNPTVVVCLDFNGTSLYNQLSNLKDLTNISAAIIISTVFNGGSITAGSPCPAILVEWNLGKAVTNYIKSTPFKPTVTMELQMTYTGSKAVIAPKVPPYSGRGPSPTFPFLLKPDLIGPGDRILASWTRYEPVTKIGSTPVYSDFELILGTSMACPHVSGVSALLKGAHPDWSVAMIRSALMTTADLLDNSGEKIGDLGRNEEPASALAMGAGHVNPNKAMEPGLVYDAGARDYVDLLCSMGYTEKQIKIISRSSRYDCSTPSMDLNYPSFMMLVPKGSKSFEKVFRRTLTNVEDGPATYTVKVSTVDGLNVSVDPEKLVFRHKHDKAGFEVSVRVSGIMKKDMDASISWMCTSDKFVVRSPILVTTNDHLSLHKKTRNFN